MPFTQVPAAGQQKRLFMRLERTSTPPCRGLGYHCIKIPLNRTTSTERWHDPFRRTGAQSEPLKFSIAFKSITCKSLSVSGHGQIFLPQICLQIPMNANGINLILPAYFIAYSLWFVSHKKTKKYLLSVNRAYELIALGIINSKG